MQRLSQVQNGNERTLTVRLLSTGFDRIELIGPEDAKIRAAGTTGFVRPIDQQDNGKYYIDCFGRSCDGATMTLVIGKADPVDMLVVGSKAGLPAIAAPLLAGRPRFAQPQYARDETLAFTRVKL